MRNLREVNFYLLLELSINPPEENEEIILSAINKKRSLWSSMINHPTKKNEARLYLEMIPAIKVTMLENRLERQKEAKRAREIKEKEISDNKNQLISIMKILGLKGYISIQEVEKIREDFSNLDESFINKTLNKFKVREITYNEKDKLDSVIYNKIRDNLMIIGKDNLYEFLGLSQSSSIDELKKASKAVYESLRKITKKDSQVTAKGELQGFCDIVFKTPSSKKEYDNKLKCDRLIEIDKIIEICSSKRFISIEEFNGLVSLIKNKNFTQREAEEYLFNYCIKNRISVFYKETPYLPGNIYTKKEHINNKVEKKVENKVVKKQEKIEVKQEKKEELPLSDIEVLPEVYDIKVRAGFRYIEITYKTPVEALSVKVWRREGKIPKAYGDGILLKNATVTGFIDKDLKDNTDYGYLICTEFNEKGNTIHSRGVSKFGVTHSTRNKQDFFYKERTNKDAYKSKEEKRQSFWEMLLNWSKS